MLIVCPHRTRDSTSHGAHCQDGCRPLADTILPLGQLSCSNTQRLTHLPQAIDCVCAVVVTVDVHATSLSHTLSSPTKFAASGGANGSSEPEVLGGVLGWLPGGQMAAYGAVAAVALLVVAVVLLTALCVNLFVNTSTS